MSISSNSWRTRKSWIIIAMSPSIPRIARIQVRFAPMHFCIWRRLTLTNRRGKSETQSQSCKRISAKNRQLLAPTRSEKPSLHCKLSSRVQAWNQALVSRLSRDLPGREMQLFRPVHHPLGKLRRTQWNLSLRNRPVIDPARAFFARIGVGQTVRRIAQSIFQRDEPITALPQHIQELANMIGLQIARVEQQNLLRFIAHDFRRQLLLIRKHRIVVCQILFYNLCLQDRIVALLGVFVESREHPVPTVERNRSDPVSALHQKCLRLPPRLQIAAGIQILMPE